HSVYRYIATKFYKNCSQTDRVSLPACIATHCHLTAKPCIHTYHETHSNIKQSGKGSLDIHFTVAFFIQLKFCRNLLKSVEISKRIVNINNKKHRHYEAYWCNIQRTIN